MADPYQGPRHRADLSELSRETSPRRAADPAPDAPAGDDSAAVSGKAAKKPVSHRRKIIVRSLIVLLAVVVLVASVAGYFLWKATKTVCSVTNGQGCNPITVISLGQQVLQQNDPTATATATIPPLQSDANGRTNILLLGTSDDRPDGANGANGAWLTDSIMIISLSQSAQNAFMISIPRDLWVKYPEPCWVGYQGKINAAYLCAGAADGNTPAQDQAAITAVVPIFENITGLQIQYAANLNYSVLGALVQAVGGSITVNVVSTDPRGIYDINTGLKLNPNTAQCPSAATQPMVCTLDAGTVLNLARARNSDGGYGLAGSNFDREQNQQAIIVGLMHQAESNGLFTNLTGVTTALDGIGANLRSTFSVSDIPAVMALARSIPAANFISLDFVNAKPAIVGTPMISGQSAVAPLAGTFNYSGIQAWIAKAMSANPVFAENAIIDVLNGSATSGMATTTANDLKDLGFSVGTIGDYSPKVPSTQIYDVTGTDPLTASALTQKYGATPIAGAPPGYTPSSGANFVVIVGG